MGNDGASNTSSLSFTPDSSWAAGDFAVATFAYSNGSTFTLPSGWTHFSGSPVSQASNLTTVACYKSLVSGDLTTAQTFTIGTSTRFVGGACAITGVASSSFVDSTATTTTASGNTNQVCPADTTVGASTFLCSVWGVRSSTNADTTLTAPGTHTTILQSTADQSSASSGVLFAYLTANPVSAGTYGSYTATIPVASPGEGSAIAFALVPAGSPPSNTAVPVITGTATEGDTLTTSTGTWTGSPTSYSYQWQTSSTGTGGWSNISGATSSSYTIQSGDVGNYLSVAVTATNTNGSTTADSASTSQVRAEGAALTLETFTPEEYGAAGNGETDDTAAIQDAINAAIEYAISSGTYWAEVEFGAQYLVAGDLQQGGDNMANAQIVIPYQTAADQPTITLVLKGPEHAGTAYGYWNNTVGQTGGCILTTTATGSDDATYGEASVIGSATPKQVGVDNLGDGDGWNNIEVVVDGINIQAPSANPTMCGFDFRTCLHLGDFDGAYSVDAAPNTIFEAEMTNTWVFGLAVPVTGNGGKSYVRRLEAWGVAIPILMGEHVHVKELNVGHCWTGFAFNYTEGTPHSSRIDYAIVEDTLWSGGATLVSGNWKAPVRKAPWRTRPLAGPVPTSWMWASSILRMSERYWTRTMCSRASGAMDVRRYRLARHSPIAVLTWMVVATSHSSIGTMRPVRRPRSRQTLRHPPLTYQNQFQRHANVYLAFTGTALTASLVNAAGANSATVLSSVGAGNYMVRVSEGAQITLTWTGTAPTWEWVIE